MTEQQTIEIKKRIKQSRKKRGLSIKDVAWKMNVTIAAVYKWERITTEYLLTLPSLDNIVLYCELLNVSADYILFGRHDCMENEIKSAVQKVGINVDKEELN